MDTTRSDVEAMDKVKTEPPRKTVLDADECLRRWENLLTAMKRAWELTPGTPFLVALNRVAADMRQFIRSRHVTMPRLQHQGFCQIYLNHMIHEMCTVLRNPHTTGADIAALLPRLTVSSTSSIYELTIAQMTQEFDEQTAIRLARIEAAQLSQPAKGGNPKDPKQKSGRPNKIADTPCLLHMCTVGCSTPRCKRTHLTTKPSAAQVTTLREAVVKSNTKHSGKPPLVLDESRL